MVVCLTAFDVAACMEVLLVVAPTKVVTLVVARRRRGVGDFLMLDSRMALLALACGGGCLGVLGRGEGGAVRCANGRRRA